MVSHRPRLNRNFFRFCASLLWRTIRYTLEEAVSFSSLIGGLALVILALTGLRFLFSYWEFVPWYVPTSFVFLLLLLNLFRVSYEESRHRLKPDVDHKQVLVALIQARAKGESLLAALSAAGGLGAPSDQAIRWEERTYRLIDFAYGEDLSAEFRLSDTDRLAYYPLDAFSDQVSMRLSRLAFVMKLACMKPLRTDFDA